MNSDNEDSDINERRPLTWPDVITILGVLVVVAATLILLVKLP
jgi:hypothetical protein